MLTSEQIVYQNLYFYEISEIFLIVFYKIFLHPKNLFFANFILNILISNFILIILFFLNFIPKICIFLKFHPKSFYVLKFESKDVFLSQLSPKSCFYFKYPQKFVLFLNFILIRSFIKVH